MPLLDNLDISRRGFVRSTAGLAGTSLLGSTVTSAFGDDEPVRPPNILFVLADQWRASAFGHASDEVVRTPNIDRLATQGINCQRAYAANPVCTPNRACLLTGRYSHQTGMITNDLMLPPVERCWPEVLSEAGYATHYVGKWHMDGIEKPGFVPPGWRRRGFQTFEGFNRGHIYHRHWGFDNTGQPLSARWEEQPDNPYYEPTLQTNLAIDFMQTNADRPFCCYLSWGPPHTPFNPPKSFEKYEPGEIQLRPNVPRAHQQRARRELAGYYGLCESLDHEMGRLLTFLTESGLADNTLLVFTADHGELAGSHGKYRKGEPEEESLNVPLVMRFPGRIATGTASQTLFNSIDLMPTLLSLSGLPNPGTCTGRDLSASMLGQSDAPAAETVYCEGKVTSTANPPNRNNRNPNPGAATWRTIISDRYKLTVRADLDQIEQLFDLTNDPFELENLAADTSHRAVREELHAELRDWGKRTGDVFPHRPASAKALYSDEEAAAARG